MIEELFDEACDGEFTELMNLLPNDVDNTMLVQTAFQSSPETETHEPVTDLSEESCWGAQLMHDKSLCTPGFVLGKGHVSVA